MRDITKVDRYPKELAERMEGGKEEAEEAILADEGERAILFVRETLLKNLPNLPKHHRETIRQLLFA